MIRFGKILLLAAWFFAFWLIGNLHGLLRMPAQPAAFAVAKRYTTEHTGIYATRPDPSPAPPSWPPRYSFIVSRDGQDIAQVDLRDILGLGWQEDSYRALE